MERSLPTSWIVQEPQSLGWSKSDMVWISCFPRFVAEETSKSGASTSGFYLSPQWCHILRFQSYNCLASHAYIYSEVFSQDKASYIRDQNMMIFHSSLYTIRISPSWKIWGYHIEVETSTQILTLFLETSPL